MTGIFAGTGRHRMTTLTWASLEGLSLQEIHERLDWATLARDVKDQLTEARHDARNSLASQLAAAEKRLGLEPCRHPRNTGAQYSFIRSQTEDHCAVCGRRLLVITDEMLARATGGNE